MELNARYGYRFFFCSFIEGKYVRPLLRFYRIVAVEYRFSVPVNRTYFGQFQNGSFFCAGYCFQVKEGYKRLKVQGYRTAEFFHLLAYCCRTERRFSGTGKGFKFIELWQKSHQIIDSKGVILRDGRDNLLTG